MSTLENLSYNKRIILDKEYHCNDLETRLYLEKSFFTHQEIDQYFLKLMNVSKTGNLECLGYIYFYLNFEKGESEFIGLYVKPEYRLQNYASLLVSNWIKLCFDNGIYNLQTYKNQRKPALLYLLKNYTFEIDNPDLYINSKSTIDICEGLYDKLKYLHFRNEKIKNDFLKGTIMKEGNYCVINDITDNYQIVDNILPIEPYIIQDNNEAYIRSLKCIKRKKED